MKYKVAIITVSDKSSKGQREDLSGKVIEDMVSSWAEVISYKIVPDEKDLIKKAIIDELDKVDLILTNGGTGLHPRDVTPDATLEIIEKEVPGIAEAMRLVGLAKTKTAMLSRAVAGIKGKTLVINLPGSPKAVRECLEVIIDALPHAIDKLKGDPSECSR
ncbi:MULTISPECIES: MogA/MoaB family molybdenum cofactor biosynthesis protein [Thermodesulfovibrio]|uniref:Molybdenum cofactor biosynthesis protein B n=1 Tax=Thermodesulfovibrio yellowstonii (strain ATCC 51303 / DSM 11347 / YP87) TaxID=289376 RepID=B5YLA6_THEYD|nr:MULTISPECIES: MogA/MoaB family molybdenum cofactor biosynthesis protein [Thermodesulfovibrio]ACI20575.1 molybdopterin biosynthesis mog protein [Thermodesulfovibrio yellowstonii DSM 11347]